MPRKYLNIILPCEYQEPWTSNLPALPHLFYFNLGLLAARFVRFVDALPRDSVFRRRMVAVWLVIVAPALGALFFVLSLPLLSSWQSSWGNLYTTVTLEGHAFPIKRGFKEGPNAWWLLGMQFPLFLLFSGVTVWYFFVFK